MLFSSEMCCKLFPDPSQQEVVCPVYTEVYTSQQPLCNLLSSGVCSPSSSSSSHWFICPFLILSHQSHDPSIPPCCMTLLCIFPLVVWRSSHPGDLGRIPNFLQNLSSFCHAFSLLCPLLHRLRCDHHLLNSLASSCPSHRSFIIQSQGTAAAPPAAASLICKCFL